jgi:hypothetical protein
LKRIFIQEDRDQAIASGLMKNTKFIPGASKAEEKGKKAPKPKKKKKTISNFFHLDKFQPKRNQKDFQRKQRKMDENLESLARLLRGLF